MSTHSTIQLLAAVPSVSLAQYRQNLSQDPLLAVTVVTSEPEARAILADSQQHTDVLVLDYELGGVYELVKELRQTYPRLLIVLVDQGADFGTPGQADDVSVQPFTEDDLLKRIRRLTEERNLETLRADALPPVRQFAKSLQRAGPGQAKPQAAVEAIVELGYDYVAFYSVLPEKPAHLTLDAQVGPEAITTIAPQQQNIEGTLLGWVMQNGQSRVVGPDDQPNHPFVRQQRFSSGACVPVGLTMRSGVIFACREQLNAITQQNVMMLELVSAQLASALARQSR